MSTTRKEYDRLRYITHRAEILSRTALFQKNHPELKKLRDRRYYLKHKDEVINRCKNYQALNIKAVHKRQRAYKRENPEIFRQYTNRRRALKKQLPSTLTIEQWNLIKLAFNFRCAYCGKRAQKLTQDHVLPVAMGGGYTSGNIVPACRSCNISKGAKFTPIQLALA